MDFIFTYSNPELDRYLTTKHLAYALVKKYKPGSPALKKEMNDFFITRTKQKMKQYLEEIEEAIVQDLTTPKEKRIAQMTKLDLIRNRGWFSDKDYFRSVQALRDHLTDLKKLGLIESKKKRKRSVLCCYTKRCLLFFTIGNTPDS